MFHQNIQGFLGKELEIELFLEKYYPGVLCITEHWLKKSENLLSIKNFSIVSVYNRESAIRGGSLIIVRNDLKVKERKDVVALTMERTIELSCVELDKHIIICVYRPPSSDYAAFESVMEDVLKLVFKSKKYILVCGDFNVDLLVDSSMSIKIINLFNSFNLSNLFLEPTRITLTTATCLDNIFCNCVVAEKAVINCLQSDHSGQIAMLPFVSENRTIKIVTRPLTVSRVEKFKNSLNKNLPYLLHKTSAYCMYGDFFKIVLKNFNDIFTQKEINVSSKIKFIDWATVGIYKSRNHLYDLYEQKNYIKDPQLTNHVKQYSKTFKMACNIAKSNYLKRKIQSSNNKIKSVWKIINSETGVQKLPENCFNLHINGSMVKKDSDVADCFEEFFENIPTKITETLNASPDLAETLLRDNVPSCNNVFKFTHIDAHSVTKTFKSLKLKNTEDLWGMSVKCIDTVITVLAPYLSLIFNECVDNGIFPDLMKYSKVVPLYKAGSKEDPSNFRPVSVLPVFSKIFEKVMLNQMLSHFNRNKIFHDQQYGFTVGRSTTDAGVMLIKHIFDAWERSLDAIGVFCDLSKAFDCVNHQILLLKLKHYGVRNKALDLIISYLKHRILKVDINGTKSKGSHMKMGVPQGSILGPFLFLIYINDLPYSMQNMAEVVLFADDTSLIFKVDRKNSNLDKANNTLSYILKWFASNNLALNTKKTKCIKFSLSNVDNACNRIVLNNEMLEFVPNTVFLGITVDSKLQWGSHIKTLAGKLSSAVFAIRKIRQLTDIPTAKIVYFSYFHSLLSYGILLWGRSADIETIFVLQKRAIRSIYNLRCRESLRERFKEIGILTVTCQYIYENIMYVRKNLSLFPKNSDRHKINTRNKNNLSIPKFRLSKVSTSFRGHCIRFYNKVSDNILNMTDNKFKISVKEALCRKAYYKIDEYLNDKNAWC